MIDRIPTRLIATRGFVLGLSAGVCIVSLSLLAGMWARNAMAPRPLAAAQPCAACPLAYAIPADTGLPWRWPLDANTVLALEPLVGAGPSALMRPLDRAAQTAHLRLVLYHRGGLRGEFLRIDLGQRQLRVSTRPPAGWSVAGQ